MKQEKNKKTIVEILYGYGIAFVLIFFVLIILSLGALSSVKPTVHDKVVKKEYFYNSTKDNLVFYITGEKDIYQVTKKVYLKNKIGDELVFE